MNWKEIEEKCPKVCTKLKQAGFLAKTTDERKWVFFGSHIRELYDFFDKNEIFIFIEAEIQYTREIDEDGYNPHYCIDKFNCILHDNSRHLFYDGLYNSRIEAEEAAFEKAFEILEDKLNGTN